LNGRPNSKWHNGSPLEFSRSCNRTSARWHIRLAKLRSDSISLTRWFARRGADRRPEPSARHGWPWPRSISSGSPARHGPVAGGGERDWPAPIRVGSVEGPGGGLPASGRRGLVAFGQKGYQFHGEWCPPLLGPFLSPQAPFALTLRAFGATWMVSCPCRKL
jgi:hypothetical protein